MGLSARGTGGGGVILGNQWASGRKNEKIVDLFTSNVFAEMYSEPRHLSKIVNGGNSYQERRCWAKVKTKKKQLDNDKAMKKTCKNKCSLFYFFCIWYHEMGISAGGLSVDISKCKFWDEPICGVGWLIYGILWYLLTLIILVFSIFIIFE